MANTVPASPQTKVPQVIRQHSPYSEVSGPLVREGIVATCIRRLQDITRRNQNPSLHSQAPQSSNRLSPHAGSFLHTDRSPEKDSSPSRSRCKTVASYVSNEDMRAAKDADLKPELHLKLSKMSLCTPTKLRHRRSIMSRDVSTEERGGYSEAVETRLESGNEHVFQPPGDAEDILEAKQPIVEQGIERWLSITTPYSPTNLSREESPMAQQSTDLAPAIEEVPIVAQHLAHSTAFKKNVSVLALSMRFDGRGIQQESSGLSETFVAREKNASARSLSRANLQKHLNEGQAEEILEAAKQPSHCDISSSATSVAQRQQASKSSATTAPVRWKRPELRHVAADLVVRAPTAVHSPTKSVAQSITEMIDRALVGRELSHNSTSPAPSISSWKRVKQIAGDTDIAKVKHIQTSPINTFRSPAYGHQVPLPTTQFLSSRTYLTAPSGGKSFHASSEDSDVFFTSQTDNPCTTIAAIKPRALTPFSVVYSTADSGGSVLKPADTLKRRTSDAVTTSESAPSRKSSLSGKPNLRRLSWKGKSKEVDPRPGQRKRSWWRRMTSERDQISEETIEDSADAVSMETGEHGAIEQPAQNASRGQEFLPPQNNRLPNPFNSAHSLAECSNVMSSDEEDRGSRIPIPTGDGPMDDAPGPFLRTAPPPAQRGRQRVVSWHEDDEWPGAIAGFPAAAPDPAGRPGRRADVPTAHDCTLYRGTRLKVKRGVLGRGRSVGEKVEVRDREGNLLVVVSVDDDDDDDDDEEAGRDRYGRSVVRLEISPERKAKGDIPHGT